IQGAAPNTIVVDQAAATFLRRRFDLEATGVARVSGTTYRVMRPGRSGFEVGARGLSPFVGRDQDLSPLQSLLAHAESGRGAAVALMGEPGVGKSRLLYEFRQSLAPGRVTYVEGRYLSYGSTIPYLPIVDIVRSVFGVVEADSAQVIGEKIRSGLHELALEPREWDLYLLHLLGFGELTEIVAGLSPETVKARTLEALRQIFLRGSRRRPMVIAVEDMQWIDRSSEDALATWAETLAACPTLLLATYRPGYQPPWLGKSYASQLALPRLSPSDSLAVVRSIVPEQRVGHDVEQRIVSQAEGVPFFLEELARAVAEQPELGSD